MAAAVETVGDIDVLVNNADISGGRIAPNEATAEDMRSVYETNVFGPVRVLHAFIPLLEKPEAPVVVNVSSGVGSLGLAADPDGPWREANYPVYASSKAALNILTIRYAPRLPKHADPLCRSGFHPRPTSTGTKARRRSSRAPRRSSATR